MSMDKHEMHMEMAMYFHTSIGNDYILFKALKPKNGKEMLIACFLTLILAVCYEMLKYLREYIRGQQIQSDAIKNYLNIYHLVQSLLHGLQFFISYCLMLIAMTYQIYLIIAIILGATIGFCIYNPLIEKIKNRQLCAEFADPCCG